MKKYTRRQRIFRAYWWFTTYYGRGNHYVTIPIKWIAVYAAISTWLKIYFGFHSTFKMVMGGIIIIILIVIIGRIDVKNNIMHEENSFNNQFIPEVQKTLEGVEYLVKKAKVKK